MPLSICGGSDRRVWSARNKLPRSTARGRHDDPNRGARISTWRSPIRLTETLLGQMEMSHEVRHNWDKADVNKNGTLEGNEATAYLDAIRKSGEKY